MVVELLGIWFPLAFFDKEASRKGRNASGYISPLQGSIAVCILHSKVRNVPDLDWEHPRLNPTLLELIGRVKTLSVFGVGISKGVYM